MSLNKSELIKRLEDVSRLHGNVQAIREKINAFAPKDSYERKVRVPELIGTPSRQISKDLIEKAVDHKNPESAAKAVSAVYETVYEVPREPQKPSAQAFTPPKRPGAIKGLRVLGGFSIGAGIFFLFGRLFGYFTPSTEWTRSVIITAAVFSAIVAACAFAASFIVQAISLGKEQLAKNEYDKYRAALDEKHNERLAMYERELWQYRQEQQAFLNEYWEWRAIYLEHLEEEESIKALLENDRQEAIKEIERNELLPAIEMLNEVNCDLVSSDYLPVICEITSLIKNGRADSLKEAINLYEELLYKERQLKLLREQEEQRKREQEQRREDEERRHYEEMMLLREQEYQRQREQEQRRQDEERRYREEQKRREQEEQRRQSEARSAEARRKQEETAAKYAEQRAMQRQCNSCAHVGHCTMAFRRPNCASFKPK